MKNDDCKNITTIIKKQEKQRLEETKHGNQQLKKCKNVGEYLLLY